MAVSAGDDEQWRIVVLPGLERGCAATIKSFTLPDPKTGRHQGFLLANRSLLEVNRFKQSHSAWLVGERLLADGGIFLATAYDPLFVLLPVLDRARDKDESCPAGKFKELEEILYDGSTPGLRELVPYVRSGDAVAAVSGPTAADTGFDGDAAAAATGAPETGGGGQPSDLGGGATTAAEGKPDSSERDVARGDEQDRGDAKAAPAASPPAAVGPSATLTCLDQQLAAICDVRRVHGTSYYRLSDDRVVAWLCCKFRRLQAALAPQVVGMDAQHAAAYALGLLAEYVCDPWVVRVARRLGINEKELAAGATHNTNTALQPADGNTVGNTRPAPPLAGPLEKKQKTDPRVAAKQAALAKQAVGTRKLTSFFAKK